MKKVLTDIYLEDICVRIYDPALQKVIAAFPSFKKASSKIGLSIKILQARADNKTRVYSDYFGKEIAVRWGKLKDDDISLIEKTNKYNIIKY